MHCPGDILFDFVEAAVAVDLDAVRREMMEELGAELADVRLLAVVENIFTYEASRCRRRRADHHLRALC